MNDYSSVPATLKKMPQWVCFKLEPNEKKGKPDKIPYDPRTGYRAKANDPSTWSDYDTVVNTVLAGQYDGIGFEFGNGTFGIDLDNVIDESGNITPEAQDIVSMADSYTEYSPSGTGLHILCLGAIPDKDRRKGFIEMYAEGRFFTVTGVVYGERKDAQERTSQAAYIHAKYLHREQRQASQPIKSSAVPLNDRELWEMMFSSKNGDRIKNLFQGDAGAYGGDSSRADQALANDLAYWTQGDKYRMDALFRQSGLMRPKWDERHGRDTYGNITLDNALASYTPYIPQTRAEKTAAPRAVTQDAAGSIPAQPANNTTDTAYQKSVSITTENPRPDAVKAYLEQTFVKDVERFKGFQSRKTGFPNLDEQCVSLYPGLYVVGAISSLGKTTFIHQLCDQLASTGDHVLYFSLEQNRLEMVTKSLSRITAQHDRKAAVSAINIRSGQITNEVVAAAEEYAEIADRVSIIECNFDVNLAYILEYVTEYMKANPRIKPVVVVDYLQIIPPSNPHQSDKEKVDSAIRGLKRMQSSNELVVFAISSLNRSNYLTPIDYESFKESGGVEYTADVVWGLQLQAINEDIFNKDQGKDVKKKRERIKDAKKENPRRIELVCLKNRYGVSSYTCGFLYASQFDLFAPDSNYDLESDCDQKVR